MTGGDFTSYPRGDQGESYTPHAPEIRFDFWSDAWKYVQKDLSTWLAVTLIFIIIYCCLSTGLRLLFFTGAVLSPGISPVQLASQNVFGLLAATLMYPLYGNLVGMAQASLRGEPIDIQDLFKFSNHTPQCLLLGFLMTLASMIAVIFCVIPMFIVNGLMLFALPLLVDRKLDAVTSIQTSIQTLSSKLLPAVILWLVLALAMVSGFIACCVGILVTIPLGVIAWNMAYADFFWHPVVAESATSEQ